MRPEMKKFLTELFVTIVLALFAMCLAMLVGCAPTKAVQSTVVADTTSVKVVHHIEQVRDTVYVEIPQIIERNVTRDTVSHLENEYAKSDAIVDGEFLWHTLEMKPQEKAVEIIKEIEYIDREIEKKVEVVKYLDRLIEAEDTRFEKTQKTVFWMVIACVITWICYAIVRNRSKVVSIIQWIKDKIM